MPHLARVVTSLYDNTVNAAKRPLAAAWLVLFGIVALLSPQLFGQQSAAFPKYEVLGVVYAPPGSASSVTYGNSQMVGSQVSISLNSSQNETESTSIGAESGFLGFGGVSANVTSGSGWGLAQTSSSTFAVQTSQGNSVATAGPVSSALGVNHDNDIIYILLNPAVLYTVTGSASFTWNGIAGNSCDMTDASDQLNIFQTVGGCDPNQYPFPDVVGIPVWCLKNPYNPSQSCAQWLPYTSRSWDRTYWGTDPSTGLPLGPMLTLRDYADILSQDPFVTQTLVPYANVPNYYCHQNPVGSGNFAYGVNLDPNDSELAVPTAPPTITNFTQPSSVCVSAGGTFTAASGSTPAICSWPANFCGGKVGSSTVSMQRFDPYDTVQYPEPGINGQPQTYTGFINYETTSTYGQSAQTTSSTESGYNSSVTIGPCILGCLKISQQENETWTWQQTTSTQNTSQGTNQAQYTIVGPQLSDNYQGPTTYNVYKDNVFGTFAFYSDLQREKPPIQLSGSAVPTAIPTDGLYGVNAPINVLFNTTYTCPTNTPPNQCAPTFSSGSPTTWAAGQVQVGSSAPPTAWVQLVNNSPWPMTMAGPAVTFSDLGFSGDSVAVLPYDLCSNQVLYPVGNPQNLPSSCTMQVQFAPVQSDAPNQTQASYPIHASLIAAGTENISGYQNILVTSTGIIVSGTATPNPNNMTGATLLPVTPPPAGGSVNGSVYTFPPTSTYIVSQQPTWTYTFSNIGSAQMTIDQIVLTDPINFFVQSITCSGGSQQANPDTPGAQSSAIPNPGNLTLLNNPLNAGLAPQAVNAAATCSVVVQFTPQSSGPFATGISVMGTISGGITVQSVLAGAGAIGTQNLPTVTVNPNSFTSSENYEFDETSPQPPYSCQPLSGSTLSGTQPITLTNHTGTAVNYPLATTNIGSNPVIVSMTETQGSGQIGSVNACAVTSGQFAVPGNSSCWINLNITNYYSNNSYNSVATSDLSNNCPLASQVSGSISPGINISESWTETEICTNGPAGCFNPNTGSTLVVSQPNTGSSLSVSAGSSGSTTLLVSAGKSFSGNVSFSCSNLPANTSCTFAPPSVNLTANSSQSTNLTVSVAASKAMARRGNRPVLPLSALAALLCFAGLNKRARIRLMLLVLVSLAGFVSLSACGGSGGSSSQHQQTTTSTITVVATSGNVSTALDVPITVTQ